jgi:hypothetical protein
VFGFSILLSIYRCHVYTICYSIRRIVRIPAWGFREPAISLDLQAELPTLGHTVDAIEPTEVWATYAILQLEDAAASWGKPAFPIGGPVQTWEAFQTKLRKAYQLADAIFQLRAKWQALRIGHDSSVTMFNDRFSAIHLDLNPHDPQTDLQLLHPYQ